MSKTNNTLNVFSDPFRSELEEIVERAVAKALKGNGHQGANQYLLTPEELADRLSMPISWVYEQSRLGNIPKHKFGKYIRFDLQEVIDSQKKNQ